LTLIYKIPFAVLISKVFWHFRILNSEGTGEKVPKGKEESQMNRIEVLYFSFVIKLHSSPLGKLTIIPVVFETASSKLIKK
jgi:hypothetical protein